MVVSAMVPDATNFPVFAVSGICLRWYEFAKFSKLFREIPDS